MKFKALLSFWVMFSTAIAVHAEDRNNDISIYTGTFDLIDKEGDDQTNLFGIEHKNPNLFRDTFLGNLSPITGALITADSAAYVYTGVEAQYKIGSLNFNPSFTP